jgi:DNA-binding GntR family transcriptional regulator
VVDLLPNRGAVVRRVTAREVREICQVRRALECEAVRLACGRIDPAALRETRGELERLVESSPTGADPHAFIEEARRVDSRLHDLIAVSADNTFLARELGRLKTLFRVFRDASWEREEALRDYRRLAVEAREHWAIVAALEAGDRAGASRAMARHIESGIAHWSLALPEPAHASERTSAPSSRKPRTNNRGRLVEPKDSVAGTPAVFVVAAEGEQT